MNWNLTSEKVPPIGQAVMVCADVGMRVVQGFRSDKGFWYIGGDTGHISMNPPPKFWCEFLPAPTRADGGMEEIVAWELDALRNLPIKCIGGSGQEYRIVLAFEPIPK